MSLSPRIKLLKHLLLHQDIDLISSEGVDVAEEAHILELNSLVGVSMDHLAILKSLTCVLNAIFQLLAFGLLIFIDVIVSCLFLIVLFDDVDTMKPLDASL